VKACQRLEVSGKRCRGRAKKTWREYVKEDMKIIGLMEKDVQDRQKWRKGLLSMLCKHGNNRR